jgi:hypothetical protein
VTSRQIRAKVLIDWDLDGTGTEETDRLISARGSLRIAPPQQSITATSGQIAQMSIELDNSDNRYSPLITTGPLYADISGGGMYHLPIILYISIDGGSNYEAVFNGNAKLPRHTTLAPGQPKTLRLDCRGHEERIINMRLDTELTDFIAYNAAGMTEAELIEDVLLNYVGLLSGELDINDGSFVIPWFWLADASPIETCWRLAAASGGRFYCPREGLFTFENWTHWLTNAKSITSQKTFDRDDFESLTLYYEDADLSSNTQVRASLYGLDDSGELWSADEALTVPPGETITVSADLSGPAYSISGITYTASTAGGTDMSASITLTNMAYATRVELEFANAHATLPAIIGNLTITGQGVGVVATYEERRASAASFWGNPVRPDTSLTRSVSSPWIQNRSQAAAFAEFLLARQELPTLYAIIEGTPGIPNRDLGDLVTIDDSEQMSAADTFFVVAIDWSLSVSGGFRQSLTCVRKGDVFAYDGGAVADGYFVLGTGGNTLGAGSTKPGRLFW